MVKFGYNKWFLSHFQNSIFPFRWNIGEIKKSLFYFSKFLFFFKIRNVISNLSGLMCAIPFPGFGFYNQTHPRSQTVYDIINTHNCFDLNSEHYVTSLCLKIKNVWYLSWNPHKSWIYPMAMCFVPNVYYVCLACAARSILEYCKCCKEKNTTTISRDCTRVSVQGVESLWGDCRFIPADWGS